MPKDAEPAESAPGPSQPGDQPPGFDVDAVDTDDDGTLDTTVLTTIEGVDLDGDGQNDGALMTSTAMTDLDGDSIPDVIETTKTFVGAGSEGLKVLQSTERSFIAHGDLDERGTLVPDDDVDGFDLGSTSVDDDHPSLGVEATQPPETPGILRGIQHVAICVDDIESADHFYIHQLGLRRTARPDIGIAGTWLQAENGVQIHLIEIPGSGGPESNHLAFTVDNVDEAADALRAKGVEVPEPTDIGTGKQAFLRDPTGNIVELNEPTHMR